MGNESIWLGQTEYHHRDGTAEGSIVTLDGEAYAKIDHVDRLDPFFISVAGIGDFWLFAGSNSSFTAGRIDPEGGLFPYQTVDKILASPDTSGARTVFLVQRGDRVSLWEPWRESGRAYRVHRVLYKHSIGTSVLFEETNEDLGLRFRWELSAGDPYGLIRDCRLDNIDRSPVEVRYLDGRRTLLPPGVSGESYTRFSYLAGAYMRHERRPSKPLGLFTLNAAVTDRAEPVELLRLAAAWTLGHPHPVLLLSDRQVKRFQQGASLSSEEEVRGELGAFYAVDRVTIASEGTHSWVHAADTRLDAADIVRLEEELRNPERLYGAARTAVTNNRSGVRRLIAGADGLQQTADATASTHHFANALYNCMRGGAFEEAYRFPKDDLLQFLRLRNAPIAKRYETWVRDLPDDLPFYRVPAEASAAGCPQLKRLTREYLPLTFSRRHGDPSRPWNHFAIHVRDEDGLPVYGYQGNWRDLFQNWESLACSVPEAIDAMITIFLNASTADGYNPYRITRDAVEWEVHNPGDAWGHIGYWGDHQIVYLLRLLETGERFHPGRLASNLREPVYSSVRVPYEIAGFEAMIANPRQTIRFNHDLHQQLLARAEEIGGDGKLLTASNGEARLFTLGEKLIIPALAKLSCLVPEGGIWLNTQRPEWNDANNALAGWGLSVVTVQYLHRYLDFLKTLLDSAGDEPIALSEAVVTWLDATAAILRETVPALMKGFDDQARYAVMEALGRASEAYRADLYRKGPGHPHPVSISRLRDLVTAALPVVHQTIRSNRRGDGLYHSYNLLSLPGDGRAVIDRLALMLEGQVAALSAGLLSPEEALVQLQSLRQSDLYDTERRSYLLYPDKMLPSAVDKYALPDNASRRAPLLAALVAVGVTSLVKADLHGRWRFHPDLRNAVDVDRILEDLGRQERWRTAVDRDRPAILRLWEEVFHHAEFTGRSGTFFMFEGLGSIYWHMVAKLLVAVSEIRRQARNRSADPATIAALSSAYNEIRNGLGFRKPPDEWGAFPMDPYSHTPRRRGAQQPGMTGQVKEEILTRWGELGVYVEGGRIRFDPVFLDRSEYLSETSRFDALDIHGNEQKWSLPAGSLAFTYCQTPVCYRLSDSRCIVVERTGGESIELSGDTLDECISASIFERRGEIARIVVHVGTT